MNPTFWTVFAAVLCAGLLLVMFVWGLVTYTRHERDGTAGRSGSHGSAIALLMPLLFALISFMVATDTVPAWLDFILQ